MFRIFVIEYYLLFNKTDVHELMPKSVAVTFNPDEITGENTLYLRIGTDTEQRDVENEWKSVAAFQGMVRSQKGFDLNKMSDQKKVLKIDPNEAVKKQKTKKDRKHKVVTLEKYKRAYELRGQGKSYKEIAKSLGCAYNEVGGYLKRFKDVIANVKLD